MDFDLTAMSILLLKQRSSDYLSDLIVSNIFTYPSLDGHLRLLRRWPTKGLIAQWIRARVSEARSRGFNSLFAQSNSLKNKIFFYFYQMEPDWISQSITGYNVKFENQSTLLYKLLEYIFDC